MRRLTFIIGILALCAICLSGCGGGSSSRTAATGGVTVSINLQPALDYGFTLSSATLVLSQPGPGQADSVTIPISTGQTIISNTFVNKTEGTYAVNITLNDHNNVIARGVGNVNVFGGQTVTADVLIMSWDSAEVPLPNTFLGKLRTLTQMLFDLPTEAQWEYACRAGTTTSYNNGTNCTYGGTDYTIRDANLDSVAWYGPDWGGETGPGTREVGTKQPNNWGLYDMHGNVWEMCLDWYAAYGGDATDPIGPSTGYARISRGGSWHVWAAMARAAQRQKNKSGRMSGFRVECAVVDANPLNAYMLVDLSSGAVTYQSSAPADLVTNVAYRTNILVMRRIPAGSFIMGSPETELGRDSGEIQHQVTLTSDFFIGVFELTQGQWDMLMSSNPSYYQSIPSGNAKCLPVENISWDSDVRGGNWPPESTRSSSDIHCFILKH